jgi:DNA (cytosine-5)-methyltransferase 1
MLADMHREAVQNIVNHFEESGYNLSIKLLNASDYGVPQDRKRVFYIGFRNDLDIDFCYPMPFKRKITLKEAIWDLQDSALSAKGTNKTNNGSCEFPNHEYMNGGFSTIYMSRNRVRNWDEQSFTIQAGGRHAPIHPQAPKMLFVEQNKRIFVPEQEHLYRRLSVRECARIQTFPDEFVFHYDNLADGYKMVGNAVPVHLAKVIGKAISQALSVASTSHHSAARL